MTKAERRRARKLARQDGEKLVDELALDDRGDSPVEFTESEAGYEARERWARRYNDLNGGPESEYDR